MAEPKKRVVHLDELDLDFSEAVVKAGGEKLNLCFQCGTCTATCPISRFNENYNPRLILRAAVLGLTERIIPNDLIWLCTSCYSCTERCPRGVRPTDVIRAIRNLAIRRGHVEPFYKLQATAIVNSGRIFEDEEFINEMRDDVGLPPIPSVNLEEISKILQNTNVKKILTSEKGEK
jgi:heterodisulfide reductase subunit C